MNMEFHHPQFTPGMVGHGVFVGGMVPYPTMPPPFVGSGGPYGGAYYGGAWYNDAFNWTKRAAKKAWNTGKKVYNKGKQGLEYIEDHKDDINEARALLGVGRRKKRRSKRRSKKRRH